MPLLTNWAKLLAVAAVPVGFLSAAVFKPGARIAGEPPPMVPGTTAAPPNFGLAKPRRFWYSGSVCEMLPEAVTLKSLFDLPAVK